MKFSNIIFLLLLTSSFCFAQNAEPCLFDRLVKGNRIAKAEQLIQKEISSNKLRRSTHDTVKVIPVVVHVIHLGGIENISDAQIESQIRILNEDFGKLPGTNGDGNGVDTKIQFCLAKKTPSGDCTDGIVRIKSSLSNHRTYERSQLKDLSYWDNTRYLNIYVVKSINNGGGTLGYSSFAGGPPDEDGVVVLHNAFGDTGTVSASSTYNLGRTVTHEISHWFGLYHTFNGGCGTDTCSDGDYVCDTPPAANPNYGCPTNVNSCSNDVPNVVDQVQNYTDYSNDACKSMFTAGQAERMHATLAVLRPDIWQPSNITSTGCDSGYVSGNCNVVADFTSNSQNICIGNSVSFINKSLNKPLSYQWSFPGGTPSSATTDNVTVTYNATGSYPVTLIAINANGSDTLTKTSYINVGTPPVGQALPFIEGFENSAFPSNGITINNPDNGITWERDTIAVPYEGSASAKINNLVNTNYGQSDALVLPSFNLTGLSYTPYIKFKWAYARSDANYSDELVVLISKDCGVTFTQAFYKTGTSLATGVTQTTPYIPDSNTVWKTASISLANFTSYSNVIIKIVNVTDGGNNLYVDDLKIGELTLGLDQIVEGRGVNIFPNPFSQELNLEYFLSKKENVQINIYDVLGKEIIKVQAGSRNAGLQKFSIDGSKLSNPGIYLMYFTVGNETQIKKIIKQ